MTTFVLFGGTGDLAKRKIIPALYSAFINGRLNADFHFYGAAREVLTNDEFRTRVTDSITNYAKPNAHGTPEQLQAFLTHTFYSKVDAALDDDFSQLKTKIANPDSHSTLFYLATGPDLFIPIVQQLSNHQLVGAQARVVLEKPLGRDAQSAREINQSLRTYLNENQIYRIDHYLGKEMVQNLLALRFANLFLEPLWNRTWIHDVQISISEQVGVVIFTTEPERCVTWCKIICCNCYRLWQWNRPSVLHQTPSAMKKLKYCMHCTNLRRMKSTKKQCVDNIVLAQ